MHTDGLKKFWFAAYLVFIIINPILIRVYPHKQGWPDLPHSNSNLSLPLSISLNSRHPPSPNQHSCSPSPLASSTDQTIRNRIFVGCKTRFENIRISGNNLHDSSTPLVYIKLCLHLLFYLLNFHFLPVLQFNCIENIKLIKVFYWLYKIGVKIDLLLCYKLFLLY